MKKEACTLNLDAQRKITVLLSYIIFFSVLNGTMFKVVIPDISEEFNLIPSSASWVITGFIMFFALGTVTYGKLGDIYPVRSLITIGLILFNLGSLVGFFSKWYVILIIARIIQACGSAAIPALAMLVAVVYFPPDKKGKVLGVISSTVAFAMGVGPILGGFIADLFNWRYLFLTTLVTVFTIPLFIRQLPNEHKEYARFDFLGALLIGGAVITFLIFITKIIWWLLLISVCLLVWFILHINSVENPFVMPSLFRNSQYRNTLFTACISMGTVFSMMFTVPLMLREVNVLNTGYIGLVIFPGAFTAALFGTFGGKMADRQGGRVVVYWGLGFLIAGYFLLSTSAGQLPIIISLNLIVCYIGFAFIQSSLIYTVSTTIPKNLAGIGMGIYNLFFFMSGAISASLTGKLLDLPIGRLTFNLLVISDLAIKYSNLFIGQMLAVSFAMLIFYVTFKNSS